MGVLAMSSSAWAFNDFAPPWVVNPADPKWAGGSVTQQSWEFWGNPSGTTSPSHWNNPFGPPAPFNPVGASPQFEPNGPGLTGVWTWHVDTTGGGFDLPIPNDPKDRPLKMIQLQYTSDRASLGAPTTNPPGTAAAGGVAGHGPSSDGDAWYTYEWLISISPNPASEVISVRFPASANIGEVDVATICYTPEPATLSLLALGGLLVLRRKRRAASR
jgi:hypothetical protein